MRCPPSTLQEFFVLLLVGILAASCWDVVGGVFQQRGCFAVTRQQQAAANKNARRSSFGGHPPTMTKTTATTDDRTVLHASSSSGEAAGDHDEDARRSTTMMTTTIPLLSPFGQYPNALELTDDDRKAFHPVVVFPPPHIHDHHYYDHPSRSSDASDDENGKNHLPSSPRPPINNIINNRAKVVTVRDLTRPSGQPELATEEQRQEWGRRLDARSRDKDNDRYDNDDDHNDDDQAEGGYHKTSSSSLFQIGRFDEDRSGLYESALFHDTSHQIDGFGGKRTIHMGIDLGGPVLTPVYSFTDGNVHAAGYNPALGDYGHVVIVHHTLPHDKSVYALYGHLDDSSQWKVGDPISRGQVVGKMGHPHQNGGWLAPHVHFQLSLHPPDSHDMPGAVSWNDRDQALQEYPDPRYVLGPLY